MRYTVIYSVQSRYYVKRSLVYSCFEMVYEMVQFQFNASDMCFGIFLCYLFFADRLQTPSLTLSHIQCPIKNIFYNNFNNKCPITIIFGIVSSQSRRHRKMVSFPTSPIQCNYLTLGNHRIQKMTNFAVCILFTHKFFQSKYLSDRLITSAQNVEVSTLC